MHNSVMPIFPNPGASYDEQKLRLLGYRAFHAWGLYAPALRLCYGFLSVKLFVDNEVVEA